MRNNAAMSAAEIIEELPRLNVEERRAVANRLRLLESPPQPAASGESDDWLSHLKQQAQRMATGKSGASIEEIINDIRDGR